MYKNYDIYTVILCVSDEMLVDAFCLLMTDELFNKLHISRRGTRLLWKVAVGWNIIFIRCSRSAITITRWGELQKLFLKVLVLYPISLMISSIIIHWRFPNERLFSEEWFIYSAPCLSRRSLNFIFISRNVFARFFPPSSFNWLHIVTIINI